MFCGAEPENYYIWKNEDGADPVQKDGDFMKYALNINSEKCKGCGLCVQFCPEGVLEFDRSVLNGNGVKPVIVTEQDACTGCQKCSVICPDALITIERTEECVLHGMSEV